MKSLNELLETASSLDVLEANHVYVDREQFLEQLATPAAPHLATELDSNGQKLICAGQQPYIDYQQSVLSKFDVLREMETQDDLFPLFLWLDTDRCGSDALMTKFAWPVFGKKGPITIQPPQRSEVELRFADVDEAVLASAIDRLGTYLRQIAAQKDVQANPNARERYMQLREMFQSASGVTLSEFNLDLTEHLLQTTQGYTPHSTVLSDLLGKPFLLEALDHLLNRLDRFIAAYNAAVDELVAQGIDPQVSHLREDYLPLFYSCDEDGQRLRLYRRSDGNGRHYASGRCACGAAYSFELGNGSLTAREVTATKRWSPDVNFPALINDQVSGFVAGKSSGLYMMVLNQAMAEALEKTPVPVLLPPRMENGSDEVDSLLYTYFME